MTTKTTTCAATTGAINDLTITTELLMTALRELTTGGAPGDREVRQWVDMAVRKLAPLMR